MNERPEDLDALDRIEAVVRAAVSISKTIRIEGLYPREHYRIMRRHRRQWPMLWKSIDELLDGMNEFVE